MTVIMNKYGYEFIECIPIKEPKLLNQPLSGSYAVVRFEGKYLLCFNTWRKQWEVPAGGREINESAEECAKRELFEETGQVVHEMDLMGLLKVRKADGLVKCNPIYFAELDCIVPFKENDETDKIIFWDLTEDIGYIDEVDKEVLKWCKLLN
ncbi:NUDIX domain-containing protein [Paenibacillus glycanilyticus]|uniref:Nudix hydrolase domain-containing protein n=1 Tax=Paenibacillus glycanilyticus TaxID=126569 RepID=A0ABQ6G7Z5_9BACL|nr:NUDIX hydrolase [Paenibacillus glycanilyticus]GLX65661.1 hypothetical protein MU1_00050 [Paenibacillus glycanilyticus]